MKRDGASRDPSQRYWMTLHGTSSSLLIPGGSGSGTVAFIFAVLHNRALFYHGDLTDLTSLFTELYKSYTK